MVRKKEDKKGVVWSIVGFVLGFLSLLVCWIPYLGLIISIISVIICGTAFNRAEKNKGLIIAGLTFSIIAVLLSLVFTLGFTFLAYIFKDV